MKRLIGGFLTLLGVSGGTYHYARNIEPRLLQINNETIRSTKIPKSYHGMKIIQFSDTHIGFHYTLEQFQELVQTINNQSPDIVVFTGDFVDRPDTYNWNDDITSILARIKAPYGKFSIYGNHDHGGYGTDILKNVMKQAGFRLLVNEHAVIEKDFDRILIAGVDDVILGSPNLQKALQHTNPDLFTVLLAHEPDFANIAKNYPIDVQLSGHSHGGQVRFPIVGHLYTPAYAQQYIQGKYELNKENFILYVNKGIGTTRLPYRFLCKPEIHVYTLASAF